MCNIWKIASRWSDDGNRKSSIIDIFERYNIVFAGRKQDYIKRAIKPNDIIAISDGIKIVSIGKILSTPKPITEFVIDDNDKKRFSYEDGLVGFKVKLYHLSSDECFNYNRGTFHRINEPHKSKIKSLFEKYFDFDIKSEFSINAKTCTIKNNSQESGNIILNGITSYCVPIYQRPYSWSEEQIGKFISDIYRSFYGYDKESQPEPMFIGTMQLSDKYIENEKQTQKIIDGQQRLTTFLVLVKLLKTKYPEQSELKSINLNWLETRVNNGEQNNYLLEFIKSDLENIPEETQNPYFKSLLIIKELFDEEFLDDEGKETGFRLDSFIQHILSNIYFVIIETRAGLSKTLQIFDAINTTGLDLNGGDIFKIRMYEYLTDKRGYGEKAFDQISELYAKIDRENKLSNLNINITEILGIYQYILISKNNLPNVLYSYGTDTFYDRLFDTIFNINQWKNFKNVLDIELSLTEIDEIIDIRYNWEKIIYPTDENSYSINFIWQSRYGKYWILIFVFMFHFKDEENLQHKLSFFIKQLSKLYIIYSIRFQRVINEIHKFTYSLLKVIPNSSFEDIIELINNKIGKVEDHNRDWYNLNWFIANNLTQNRNRKNIICRLSALLEEDYKSPDKVKEIVKKIFYSYIDIEHVQSYNDQDIEERDNIIEQWGDELNSIGNLMVLESSINRSIHNEPYYIKKESYIKSQFEIAKKQPLIYENWNLNECKKRKEKEIEKLISYLFG